MSKQNIFKRTLILKLLLLLSFCFTSFFSNAQGLDDLDSLLMDRDIENYSIRIFSNYKANKFNIKDNNSRVRFVPNNRHGLGFGVANKKIIIDIAFNLKNPNKENTRRFDLQGTTILKNRHYINGYFQTYKGYSAKNNFDEATLFRKDVRSVSLGFNYLYTLDDVEFSYSLLKSGLPNKRNDDIFITAGFGFFGLFDYFSAKPSILSDIDSPYFNEEGNIKRYQGTAVGALAGLVSYFKLPKNITATVNVMPGLGLMHKKVTLQDDSYNPSQPIFFKFDFLVGLGYNFNRFYTVLTYSNSFYSTNLDNDNTYFFNLTNAKLAIGYRLKRHKKR